MKKLVAIMLLVLAMLTFVLTAAGCETMMDNYESDTFELGESSLQ